MSTERGQGVSDYVENAIHWKHSDFCLGYRREFPFLACSSDGIDLVSLEEYFFNDGWTTNKTII